MMDALEAVGHVRVIKKDIKTAEILLDKLFKNQITNYARTQMVQAWGQSVNGVFPSFPSKIAVGTGTPPAGQNGTTPNDTSLWNEYGGSRKQVDYAQQWLQYYIQYSVTYQNTEALAAAISNFSDALTEYSGSSATGWVPSGNVSYGASGVTAVTNANIRSTVATNMDPNANGPVTAQVTFKLPTATPSSDYIHLYQDSQNFYEIYLAGTWLVIGKTVANTHTQLIKNSTAITWTAGAFYTLTASIDQNGVITANVYSGTTATGTPIASITYTDTSLPGPYSLQIGGDANLVMSNAQTTYPNSDTTLSVQFTEAGLFDVNGNMFSHVMLNGVSHDNTSTLSIQWQILQKGN